MSGSIKLKIGLWVTIILVVVTYPFQTLMAAQMLQQQLEDGAVLRVHLEEDPSKEQMEYVREILQLASHAYRKIVFEQGFNRNGYTFASASKAFAYDSDQTIDIYIIDIESPFTLMTPQGGMEYKAKIFVPLDYKAYQKRYKITNPHLELKACLMHEILHIVIYSYNRNMQETVHGKISLTSQNWDWYTEGLARYFETLVGYQDEFLSAGFRRTKGRVTVVYKGGVNYFLKYPDRPLHERKYDFALFWQYLHRNYGMDKIEEISYKFRQINPRFCSNQEAMQIIAQTLSMDLDRLWEDFSLYAYKISSSADEREKGLKPVAISELSSRKSQVYDISSFGFDFYQIDASQHLESLQIKGDEKINCLIGICSAGNIRILPLDENNPRKVRIDLTGLSIGSKMIIMLSNPTDRTNSYRLSIN